MSEHDELESALSSLMQTAHELYPVASAQAENIEFEVQRLRATCIPQDALKRMLMKAVHRGMRVAGVRTTEHSTKWKRAEIADAILAEYDSEPKG